MTDAAPRPDLAARLDRLRERMAATGTDLVALGPGLHMHWAAGFHPLPCERPCLLLVGEKGAGFLMPALNAEGSRAETDLPFWTWDDAEGPEEAFDAAVRALAPNPRRIALDEAMRADAALLLVERLPQAQRRLAEDTVGALRMIKDEAEIAALRRSAALADEAMSALFAALRPGMTEREARDVAFARFAEGGAAPIFGIVGGGPRGAFPHHQTSAAPLSAGEAIVVDIGARLDGWPSDITRMAAIGETPAGYAEVHAVVEAAVQAALAAVRPGAVAREIDAAAREVITAAGHGPRFVHRTGHGLGLDVHEGPWITATSETVLEPGMVFSIEPGIYLPGRFGIRLEEIVVVRDTGAEILSALPRALHVA